MATVSSLSTCSTPAVTSPDDIVDTSRNGHFSSTPVSPLSTEVNRRTADSPTSSSSSETFSAASHRASCPASDQTVDDASATQMTAVAHASDVIKHENISLNTKLAVFTVVGSTEPRVVRLFPTTSCSCPAKSNCYHALAARMAVGIHADCQRRPVSLTQLRRNKRKRCDKVSGRERPRANDVYVIPAADTDHAGNRVTGGSNQWHHF